MALRVGTYTREEIQGNLGLCYSLPFLDDSIQIERVPSYDQEFGPMDAKWNEYLESNREAIVPKLMKELQLNIVTKNHFNKKVESIKTFDFFI